MNTEFEIVTDRFVFNRRAFTASEKVVFKPHIHNCFELIFLIDGKATYIIEGKKYKLRKYDLIITRPFQYHCIEIDDNSVYDRFNLLADADDFSLDLDRIIPKETEIINCGDGTISENFKKCSYYSKRLSKEDFTELSKCLIKEIIFNISINAQYTVSPSQVSPIIEKALEYINRNLYTIKSITEICEYLYITQPYFFKIFKEQLSISPMKYITVKRLREAQRLIVLGKKPSKVYLQCGFSSYNAFYKRYIDLFGYSPSTVKNGDYISEEQLIKT